MDLTLLVGEYFNSKKTSSVWKVTAVDSLHDKIECKERIAQVPCEVEYIKFKERFESGACEFIDGPSYTNWGSMVTKGHNSIFQKVESSFGNVTFNNGLTPTLVAKPTNVTGEWTVDNPLWNHQYMINDVATRIYGEFKKEYKKPNCECGAHAIGVKDYQGGHAHYCPVHKT